MPRLALAYPCGEHEGVPQAPRTDPQSAPLTFLARTNHRGSHRAFGIRAADRSAHLYMIGRTGAGKSTLIRLMALQDALLGRGLAVFDPHGDLAEALARRLHRASARPFHYLSGASPRWHFNPLECAAPKHRALLAAGLVDTFKKIWADDWGPRLEHLLRHTLFTLLETPGATLGDIPRLLGVRDYRRSVTACLRDPVVRSFWQDEFEKYSPAFRAVVTAPLLNKVGALLIDPNLRAILTASPKSTISLRRVMDTGSTLLVNLSKGRMGEGPSALLGALMVSHLALEGLARADRAEHARRPFYVYLDEFQTFSTRMLATMLSELRKYNVSLVLAHQYLSQLDAEVRDAVLGNVGTMMCFRVGAEDAPFLARELEPTFSAHDLVALPNHHVYLRLMIEGCISKPFSATTFAEIEDVPGFGKSAYLESATQPLLWPPDVH